tara:strand:- start:1848 stop:2417 length:570 start_codon:yes stop_codon:yes gene_type:complete
MFQVGKTLVSKVILDHAFCCDLSKCKGACCVEGDGGAPLDKEEQKILNQIQPMIRPYLRLEGLAEIDLQGPFVFDEDGECSTPLVNKKECAYVVFESGVAKCGIEKAYEEGAIKWPKPLSCHLYPIRINRYESFHAVNVHHWRICEPACSLGQELQLPVFRFLKNGLKRAFGSSWYEEVESIYKETRGE